MPPNLVQVPAGIRRFALPQAAIFDLASIDGEHRGLIDTLNAALAEFGGGPYVSGARFAAHIGTLCRQMADHFVHEEHEMVRARYSEADAHAAHHAAVLTRLDSMHEVVRLKPAIGIDATFDLFDHLLDDVLRADLAFKDYLAARGVLRTR